MSATPATLAIALNHDTVFIKIGGRASFTSSVDFKTAINSLRQNGYQRFVLDLTQCLLMDSTFLGVLAGLGLKLNPNGNGHSANIQLLNPSTRVADLLENLGVTHLFQLACGPELGVQNMAEVAHQTTDKVELQQTCLEAHQTLMNVNPNNVPKFKDVAQFLAEDLKRLEAEKKGTEASVGNQ